MQADVNKSPFGLSGGIFLSGSINVASTSSYCYYPLSSSNVIIQTANIISGSSMNLTGINIPIYGEITAVSQSSGIAILYLGQPDQPRYR